MTSEDKLRLDELGKFGISITDREWIVDLIKRQDAEIEQLKTELIMGIYRGEKDTESIEELSAALPKIRVRAARSHKASNLLR
jgi:hypothetical protein